MVRPAVSSYCPVTLVGVWGHLIRTCWLLLPPGPKLKETFWSLWIFCFFCFFTVKHFMSALERRHMNELSYSGHNTHQYWHKILCETSGHDINHHSFIWECRTPTDSQLLDFWGTAATHWQIHPHSSDILFFFPLFYLSSHMIIITPACTVCWHLCSTSI